jgi:hypothetical protein
MRPRLATAASLVALSAAPVARAAEPLTLEWSAPAGCPSHDAVLADVQRILGVTTPHRARVRADVTQFGPEQWSLRLSTEVDGVLGERTLEANSCASLAAAAALILAWTVDPEKARAVLPSQPGVPTPDVAAASERLPSPAPPSERAALIVAAGGLGEVGTLPSIGGGLEITLGAFFGPVRVEVLGADWLRQDLTQPVRGTIEGTHVHLMDGAMRGCFRGRLGARLEVDPCVGAALVFATSEGFGGGAAFTPFTRSSWWSALQADALAVWRVAGPLGLRLSVGAGVPLVRPSFVLQRRMGDTLLDTVLYEAAPVAVRATFGLEARFP